MPSVYRPIERVIEHIGIRNGKLLAVYNGPEGNELRVYQANGGVFIVQVFKSDAGVDIWPSIKDIDAFGYPIRRSVEEAETEARIAP